MLKSQILEKLQKKHNNLSNDDIEQLFNIFIKKITNSLKNGQNIEIRGFGTFFIKRIKEKYNARNPKTSELIYVPEKNKVRFRASKKLKRLINEKN